MIATRPLQVVLLAAVACGGCATSRTSVADRGAPGADAEAAADIARAIEAAEPIDSAGELAPPPAAEPGAAPQRSIVTLDRSHWPTIVVRPSSGTVEHAPAYLGGRAQTTLEGVDVAELTADERVELALGPAYEGSPLWNAIWEPVRTGGQIVALPFNLITQPPGSRVSSGVRPPGPAATGSGVGLRQRGDLSPGSPGHGAGPGFGGGAGGTGGGGAAGGGGGAGGGG